MRGRLDDADATAHFGGLNLNAAATPADRPRHPDRLRHQLPRRPGRRVPVRGVRPHCRSRSSTPASSATATRRSTATRIVLAITQSRRDGRHARRAARSRSGRGTRRWPSATSSAAPSPARPTAASTCTPARRSASPAPRRSPRRCTVLTMLALYLGRMRHLSSIAGAADHRRPAGAAGRRPPDARLPRPGEGSRREVRRRARTSSTSAGSTSTRSPSKGR